MNKWILCVVLSSAVGSLVYGIWWLLSRRLRRRGAVDVIYHTLRVTTVLFAVLVFAGLGFSLYLEWMPSQSYWGVETPALRQLLNGATMIWALGAVYRLLCYVRDHVRLYRRVNVMSPCETMEYQIVQRIGDALRLTTPVQVYRGEDLLTPELVGLMKAKILLPDEEYTEAQLSPILTHELIHHKYHDRLMREVAVLIHCIHWWNPVVRCLHRSLEQWDELHCDACVCDCDHIRKKDYAQVLYHISERAVTHRQILHTALVEGGSDMVERMRQIQVHKKGRARRRGLTVMVTLLLVLCTGSVSLAAGAGTYRLYDLAVDQTTVGEEEQLQPLEELVEYEVYVGEDFLQTLESANVEILAESSGTISTTLAGSRWSSGAFQASAGQGISVAVMPDPTTVQLKVGIFEPDGYLRYVLGSGSVIAHDFELDQTGEYYVIVQNDTNTKVSVVGSYQTKDIQ